MEGFVVNKQVSRAEYEQQWTRNKQNVADFLTTSDAIDRQRQYEPKSEDGQVTSKGSETRAK